jgi:RNA polymerase sigma-70 factor, ECF subfamily
MGTNHASNNFEEGAPAAPSASIENDHADWGQFLSAHRSRLRRMVALRLDQRLRGRIDPSDVIQEAFIEATERRPECVRQADVMPPFLWLRLLTLQRLHLVHRRQLGTRSRHAGREISIHGGAFPAASSAALAAQLLGRDTRPSEAAIRAERKRRLEVVLESMDPIDREVLVLRHFEQLRNCECARVLGLGESAATKRYLRALRRLKDILSTRDGGPLEAWT